MGGEWDVVKGFHPTEVFTTRSCQGLLSGRSCQITASQGWRRPKSPSKKPLTYFPSFNGISTLFFFVTTSRPQRPQRLNPFPSEIFRAICHFFPESLSGAGVYAACFCLGYLVKCRDPNFFLPFIFFQKQNKILNIFLFAQTVGRCVLQQIGSNHPNNSHKQSPFTAFFHISFYLESESSQGLCFFLGISSTCMCPSETPERLTHHHCPPNTLLVSIHPPSI